MINNNCDYIQFKAEVTNKLTELLQSDKMGTLVATRLQNSQSFQLLEELKDEIEAFLSSINGQVK